MRSFLLLSLLTFLGSELQGQTLQTGPWQASLQSPGGELKFGLEFRMADKEHRAWIINGEERIAVPQVVVAKQRINLLIPHYGSRITASISADGRSLRGRWHRVIGKGERSMAFQAQHGIAKTTERKGMDLTGKWAVQFSSSEESAVGIFQTPAKGGARGTFLTTTGDYRYLVV